MCYRLWLWFRGSWCCFCGSCSFSSAFFLLFFLPSSFFLLCSGSAGSVSCSGGRFFPAHLWFTCLILISYRVVVPFLVLPRLISFLFSVTSIWLLCLWLPLLVRPRLFWILYLASILGMRIWFLIPILFLSSQTSLTLLRIFLINFLLLILRVSRSFSLWWNSPTRYSLSPRVRILLPSSHKADFEPFFAVSQDPPVLSSKLAWCERILVALEDADNRLLSHVSSERFDTNMILATHTFYGVVDNPSRGKFLPLNDSFSTLFDKVPSFTRLLGVSLKEAEVLESSFRNMFEILSHSMWILSGVLAYVKSQGFVPRDPSLFDQLVSSLSKGMAQQANSWLPARRSSAANEGSFTSLTFPLISPLALSDFLFSESVISRLLEVSCSSAALQSQQAIVEVASKGSGRSRSPCRSSGRSFSKCGSLCTPPRSSKCVKFSDRQSILKSTPSSSQRNFTK